MEQKANDVASGLARLHREHPGWFFTTCWVAEQVMFLGQKNGVIVGDRTPGAVTAKVRREEARLIPRDLD